SRRFIKKTVSHKSGRFLFICSECIYGITVPLIFKETGVSPALEYTVMVRLIGPSRLVSYFTSIISEAPGAISPVGFLGIVHPHVDFTSVITNGWLPVLVNLNVRVPSLPFLISP